MDEIEFVNSPILTIDTENLTISEEESLIESLNYIISTTPVVLEIVDDSIYPRDGYYQIRELVDALKKILIFLNSQNVSWIGTKTAFKDGEELGFMLLKDATLTIGYLIVDGSGGFEVEKEYITLIKKKL